MRELSLAVFAIALSLPIRVCAQSAPKSANASRSYYSEAQASRGKQQYAQYCAQCHMANLKGAGTAPALVGDEFLHDYYRVGDLFSKVNVTMPGDNVHGLSADNYLNIIAYLLQANGLPAGTENLKRDVSAMKRMAIVERKVAKSATGSPGRFLHRGAGRARRGLFPRLLQHVPCARAGQPRTQGPESAAGQWIWAHWRYGSTQSRQQ